MAFTLCMVFTGCSSMESKEEEWKPSPTTSPATTKPTISPEIERTLTFIKQSTIQTMCENENGIYHIALDEDGEANLMYIDYQSKQQIYLCNKSDCNHKNETCSSYFVNQFSLASSTLFCNENYLYYFVSERDQTGSTSSSESVFSDTEEILGANGLQVVGGEPAKLYRMNLDGTGIQLLSEFKAGYVIQPTLFYDEEYLYGIALKNTSVKIDDTTTYQGGSEYELVRTPLAGGRFESIAPWQEDTSILGCYQNQVVTVKIKYAHELTNEERANDKEYSKLYDQASEVLALYNMESGQWTELGEVPVKDGYYYVMEGEEIYYSRKGGGEIRIRSLKTGKEERLETKYNNIIASLGEYLILSDWSENTPTYIRYEKSTQKIEAMSYINEAGRPIGFLGETESFYFVESNCKTKTEYVEWAGVTQDYLDEFENAILSKEDFKNNTKKYESVSMQIVPFN